jgi:hypothetical protein
MHKECKELPLSINPEENVVSSGVKLTLTLIIEMLKVCSKMTRKFTATNTRLEQTKR